MAHVGFVVLKALDMGFRIQGFRVFNIWNNGDTNGEEKGKLHGSWVSIGVGTLSNWKKVPGYCRLLLY